MSKSPECPCCFTRADAFFKAQRPYLHCPQCDLVFVAPEHLPSREAERERYEKHENDPNDAGYCAFLMPLVYLVKASFPAGTEGLDYGSGPTPALAELLENEGFRVTCYDPFFQPDAAALARRYAFVVCVETAEHFHRPFEEFSTLARCLEPGGELFVRTEMLEDWAEFPRWHYPRDVTHVSFYSRKTMQWIASRFGWECRFSRRHVTLFTRPKAGSP